MHPDVPIWAREILEREVAHVEFTSFHVLKDTVLHKLGVGHAAGGETFVVQKSVAGGELYRVQPRRNEAHALDAVLRSLAPLHAADAASATCRDCGTTFRYWRERSAGGVYCFACGATITQDNSATQDAVAPPRSAGTVTRA